MYVVHTITCCMGSFREGLYISHVCFFFNREKNRDDDDPSLAPHDQSSYV